MGRSERNVTAAHRSSWSPAATGRRRARPRARAARTSAQPAVVPQILDKTGRGHAASVDAMRLHREVGCSLTPGVTPGPVQHFRDRSRRLPPVGACYVIGRNGPVAWRGVAWRGDRIGVGLVPVCHRNSVRVHTTPDGGRSPMREHPPPDTEYGAIRTASEGRRRSDRRKRRGRDRWPRERGSGLASRESCTTTRR